MDEKQTAALREVFEQWWCKEGQFHMAAGVAVDREHDYRAWLACYQHLAPMVEDAERYRAIRQCGREWSNLCVFDSRGALIADELDREADALIDAAREQEKKIC